MKFAQRRHGSTIKFNNLLKKSESGIEGSTETNYRMFSNDGEGTTPIDSINRQNYEFISPQGGRLVRNRFKSLDKQNFVSLGSRNM